MEFESDDSSDTFTLDFHIGRNIKQEGVLCHDWEAIEHSLYGDGPTRCHLNPKILHECRLWRDSFPHLRICGRRIENPYNLRKEKLKHQIILQVVDQIIDRIDGGLLNIGKEKGVQQKTVRTKECYFERGKEIEVEVDSALGLLESLRIESTQTSSTSSTPKETPAKALPRGILKNTPSSTRKKVNERRRNRDTFSNSSFRKSTLPRISPTTNNWLFRGERGSEITTASRRSAKDYPHPKRFHQDRKRSKIVFPPIATPNEYNI